MIVFNLWAILAALIAAAVYAGIGFVAPSVLEGAYGDLVFAGTILIVGALTEVVGIKGRVFWLPIWFWGIVGMGIELYGHWGWWGPALAVVVAVGLFGALMMAGYRTEKREWAEAPQRLERARADLHAGALDTAWEHLEAAYFDATLLDLTAEMATHNRGVIAAVYQLVGVHASPTALQLFGSLDADYARVEAGEEGVEIEQDSIEAMTALLENRGAPPEGETPEPAAQPYAQPQQAYAQPQQPAPQPYTQPVAPNPYQQPPA